MTCSRAAADLGARAGRWRAVPRLGPARSVARGPDRGAARGRRGRAGVARCSCSGRSSPLAAADRDGRVLVGGLARHAAAAELVRLGGHALIAAGAVVLTRLARRRGGLDLRGLFDASPGPGTCRPSPRRCRCRARVRGDAAAHPGRRRLAAPALAAARRRAAAAWSWAVALGVYLALVEVAPPPGRGSRTLGPGRRRGLRRRARVHRRVAGAVLRASGAAGRRPASSSRARGCRARTRWCSAAGCSASSWPARARRRDPDRRGRLRRGRRHRVGMLFEALGRAAAAARWCSRRRCSGAVGARAAFTSSARPRGLGRAREPERARRLDDPACRRRPPLAVRRSARSRVVGQRLEEQAEGIAGAALTEADQAIGSQSQRGP